MECIKSIHGEKFSLKLNNCSLGQDIYHFLLNITFSSKPILSFTALCYCHSTVHCLNLPLTLISHELYFPFTLPDINFRIFPITHIYFVFACLYALFNVSAIKSGFTVPRCVFLQTWIRMHMERKNPRLILYNAPGIFLELSREKKRIVSTGWSPGYLAGEVPEYNGLLLLYCNGTLRSAIISPIVAVLPPIRWTAITSNEVFWLSVTFIQTALSIRIIKECWILNDRISLLRFSNLWLLQIIFFRCRINNNFFAPFQVRSYKLQVSVLWKLTFMKKQNTK